MAQRPRAAGVDAERARDWISRSCGRYLQGRCAASRGPADGCSSGVPAGYCCGIPRFLAWGISIAWGVKIFSTRCLKQAKSVKPTAEVGWHVDHQPSSWDVVYRAEMSVTRRWRRTAISSSSSRITRCWGREFAIGTCHVFRRRSWANFRWPNRWTCTTTLFGYDKNVEPEPAGPRIAAKGVFAEITCFSETKRSVASAAGKTRIYTGIGFDVPGSPPD